MGELPVGRSIWQETGFLFWEPSASDTCRLVASEGLNPAKDRVSELGSGRFPTRALQPHCQFDCSLIINLEPKAPSKSHLDPCPQRLCNNKHLQFQATRFGGNLLVSGRKWQPIPVFLPGESYGQRSLVDCPWGCRDLDMTEHTHTTDN